MKVLVNGRLIGRSEASIDLEDRGYQFGDGIYEVIRVYKGVLFGLREHAERFFRSAAEIGISLPFSIEDLEWDLQKLALFTNYMLCNSCLKRLGASENKGSLMLQAILGLLSRCKLHLR